MAQIKLTTVAFKGTAAQEAKLRAELRTIKDMPGSKDRRGGAGRFA